MTNKVKPFYIKITEDITPQMVQDAFDKCVDAGANAEECISDTNRKHNYQDACHKNFNYFGVSDYNETYLTDDHCNYGDCAQEITLDQLDEWLGLAVEQEWDGKGLPPVGVECEAVFVKHEHKGYGEFLICGYHKDYVWMEYIGNLSNKSKHYTAKIFDVVFRKPETPEQKAERELYEAIEEGYNLAPDGLDTLINQYVAKLLYQQGYRKQ